MDTTHAAYETNTIDFEIVLTTKTRETDMYHYNIDAKDDINVSIFVVVIVNTNLISTTCSCACDNNMKLSSSLIYSIFNVIFRRISVIFRVRSAKAVKITDAALLKRLGIICGCIGICLFVRTVVAPPLVVVGRTVDDLKAYLCKTDWWDHTFTTSKYFISVQFACGCWF